MKKSRQYHPFIVSIMFVFSLVFGSVGASAQEQPKPQASQPAANKIVDKNKNTGSSDQTAAVQLPATREMKMIAVLKDDVAWDGKLLNALPHPRSMTPEQAIATYNKSPAGKNYRIVALGEHTAPPELKTGIATFKNSLKPDLRDGTMFTIIAREKSTASTGGGAGGSQPKPNTGGE